MKRPKAARNVQAGHTRAEQEIYSALWNHGTPTSDETRICSISQSFLAEETFNSKRTVRRCLHALVAKLSIEIVNPHTPYRATEIKVYPFGQILRRRNSAGLTHVSRRGVFFGSGSQQREAANGRVRLESKVEIAGGLSQESEVDTAHRPAQKCPTMQQAADAFGTIPQAEVKELQKHLKWLMEAIPRYFGGWEQPSYPTAINILKNGRRIGVTVEELVQFIRNQFLSGSWAGLRGWGGVVDGLKKQAASVAGTLQEGTEGA